MTTNLFRAFLLIFLLAGIAACDKGEAPAGGEPVAEEQTPEQAPAVAQEPESEEQLVPEPAAATVDEPEPGAADASDRRRNRQERDPEVELAQMIHDIWWNAPEIYAALDLTEEQRSAMDSSLQDYAESQLARTDSTPQLMEQYREAVNARDFEEAQRLSNEMADIAGKGMSANFDLQLAVLGLLNEEQLTKAIADYPGMMARQWVRGRRVMGGQQLGRNAGAARGGPGMGHGERRMGQGQGERRMGKGKGQRRRQQGQGDGNGQDDGNGQGEGQGEDQGGGDG